MDVELDHVCDGVGGVVSPILANVYLHEVLDLWFAREVQPRLRGQAHLIRFADDAVLVFGLEGDARRVLDVLPKRFAKYGLTLHPTKTRLIPFVRPRRPPVAQAQDVSTRPGTFDLLGFNHHWALSRARNWVVVRETCRARFKRAATRIDDWCQTNRHSPVRQQRKTLAMKLNGHCQYYGITGNARALARFRYALIQSWQRWLDRRSQKRKMPWHRFTQLLQAHPIPAARAVHSLLRRGANV
jgi:RNA-directed DNA polymerase